MTAIQKVLPLPPNIFLIFVKIFEYLEKALPLHPLQGN
jgi:hypothetical protein